MVDVRFVFIALSFSCALRMLDSRIPFVTCVFKLFPSQAGPFLVHFLVLWSSQRVSFRAIVYCIITPIAQLCSIMDLKQFQLTL